MPFFLSVFRSLRPFSLVFIFLMSVPFSPSAALCLCLRFRSPAHQTSSTNFSNTKRLLRKSFFFVVLIFFLVGLYPLSHRFRRIFIYALLPHEYWMTEMVCHTLARTQCVCLTYGLPLLWHTKHIQCLELEVECLVNASSRRMTSTRWEQQP